MISDSRNTLSGISQHHHTVYSLTSALQSAFLFHRSVNTFIHPAFQISNLLLKLLDLLLRSHNLPSQAHQYLRGLLNLSPDAIDIAAVELHISLKLEFQTFGV